MAPQPPPGFIHLVLLPQEDPFYLEIPITIVATVSLSPRKYLRYLGWCVLGVVGVLKDDRGIEISLDGELLDRGIYCYIVPGHDILTHAVDLEVIKQRSKSRSETSTQTCDDFRTRVLQRDGYCVWTSGLGMAMYIIPHARGDEWVQRIIENRPHDENIDSLGIDDIRNGIYADDTIHHHLFDPRCVVILKTPNPILQTTDVPNRYQRNIPTKLSYPVNSRYTLQWIVAPENEYIQSRAPNNNDATFMDQRLPKPADLLLHYNYGAAVVKQWGKNSSVLANRHNLPCPPASIPALMGPTKFKHDRNIAIQKRAQAAAVSQGGQGASGSGSRNVGAAADFEAQDKWDEDDIMLFFWGNSKGALERHTQKKQEHTKYLEDWRTTVTGDPPLIE